MIPYRRLPRADRQRARRELPVPRKQAFIVKPVAASPLIAHIQVDRPFHAGDGRMLGVGINRVRLRAR